MAKKPKKLQVFTVNSSARQVLEILKNQVETLGYRLEAAPKADEDLLISDNVTATSWGFYYFIYLTEVDKHATRVEVGIKSKLFQIGPVVTKHLRQCRERLEELLSH